MPLKLEGALEASDKWHSLQCEAKGALERYGIEDWQVTCRRHGSPDAESCCKYERLTAGGRAEFNWRETDDIVVGYNRAGKKLILSVGSDFAIDDPLEFADHIALLICCLTDRAGYEDDSENSA
jgi:hypothetical protein